MHLKLREGGGGGGLNLMFTTNFELSYSIINFLENCTSSVTMEYTSILNPNF
jgi:hypothetical protein